MASLQLAAGAPITGVSAQLAHSSVNNTLGIYSHVIPGAAAVYAAAFEAAIDGQSPRGGHGITGQSRARGR